MSRAFYRQMSRSRATLNNQTRTGLSPEELAQLKEEATAARTHAGQQAQAVVARVAHPVVTVPDGFQGYRVVRLFMVQGHRREEPIQATRVKALAAETCQREKWRAQVLDAFGLPIVDNWADMERR